MTYDTEALRVLTQRIFNPNTDNGVTDDLTPEQTFLRKIFNRKETR